MFEQESSVFFSDCQRYTLTQKVKCASPSVSNRFRSPGFKRFTADFDNCGTLPITTIGFRSSSVAQHLARPRRFVETPASSQVEHNLREHAEQAAACQQVSLSKRLLPPRTFHISPLSVAPSHLVSTGRVGSLGGLANPESCPLSSCSSSCVHFAARRSCSTAAAAAAALARDHVLCWRHFTFPSLGFFETFGSRWVVTHCTRFCIRCCEN